MNAEISVLGACVCDASCFWRVADLLTADDFSNGQNARLYAFITAKANSGSAFDAVTIGEEDPALGDLALSYGSAEGWRTANVRSYAEMIVNAATARRVKQAGQQIARLEGQDVLGEAQRLIGACATKQVGAVKHIREYLRESVFEMQRRVESDSKLIGTPTSLVELDGMTCGWQRGDLVVLAARPSVGKTAFSVQAAIAASRAGHEVLFMSLEMSGVQLADRVQAHIARVDASGIRNPKLLDDADFTRLFNAAAEIAELPLHIDETSGLTVEAIGARARQVNATKRLGLIVIDYLSQIKPPRANSTNDGIQEITRALKALAKELQVPILLLCQLNRDADGHRPTLKSLRDSGAIEQDADVVIFLHRPDDANRRYAELIIAKQRNGVCDDLGLDTDMKHMTFSVVEKQVGAAMAVQGVKGYGRKAA